MPRLRDARYDHPDVEGLIGERLINLYHECVHVVNGIAETSDPLTVDILIAQEGFVLVEDQDDSTQEEEDGLGAEEVEATAPASARKSRRTQTASA